MAIAPGPLHPSEGRDDKELVAKFLRHREEGAFREIYRRHGPALDRIVTRIVGGNEGDAEDVIQVTWIRAVEGLGNFRWRSTLRTWLTGIALNCSRELLRKRGRSSGGELYEEAGAVPAPQIPREVHRVDLERAIAELPAGYREVLVLHDVEGYTHEEIGRFLGVECGTSKSQLSRARRAMRSLLGGNGYGDARRTTEQRR